MLFLLNHIKDHIKVTPVRLIAFQLALTGLTLSALPAYANTTDGAATTNNASVMQSSFSPQKKQSSVLSVTFNKPVKYSVFTLTSPHRVVIDLKKTHDAIKLTGKKPSFISRFRHSRRNTDDLRIVLDLKQAAILKTSMQGKQLKIALTAPGTTKANTPKRHKKPLKKIIKPTRAPALRAIASTKPRKKTFVVAIDAGHGGKDPGAVGAKGTFEKNIVLQIAKRLQQRVNKTPGMKGILVRNGDYYVPLRERMQIARKKQADLFISIHADANPNRHLTGSSVYVLSQNGASSEAARWLASNENAYENKLGSTSLDGKDNVLRTMLMDLAQAETIDNSLTLANNTLRELGHVTKLLHSSVESAAFVVLKSPDIPSILVETAFISNPSEERRLKTAQYQNKLANAVFNGIKRFQLAHAPDGKMRKTKRVAQNKKSPHIVKQGDSLIKIARKYGVSTNKLSHHNKLTSSKIHIGQTLYIPTPS